MEQANTLGKSQLYKKSDGLSLFNPFIDLGCKCDMLGAGQIQLKGLHL